jgi:hypothetical protein
MQVPIKKIRQVASVEDRKLYLFSKKEAAVIHIRHGDSKIETEYYIARPNGRNTHSRVVDRFFQSRYVERVKIVCHRDYALKGTSLSRRLV